MEQEDIGDNDENIDKTPIKPDDKSDVWLKKIRIGFLKGQFSVPDNFDRMCEDEIIQMFYAER